MLKFIGVIFIIASIALSIQQYGAENMIGLSGWVMNIFGAGYFLYSVMEDDD